MQEMPKYINVNEAALEYKTTGDWLLENAEEEFRKGDLVQASEKTWGAVAQYLKALATERGWAHDSHAALLQATEGLHKECDDINISRLSDRARSLHSNFYSAALDPESVRERMDDVKRLIVILRNISPPKETPRRTHIRERPFHRTRSGRL